jgi:hypothetical protein
MGIFDSILDRLSGITEEEAKITEEPAATPDVGVPFTISTTFHPVRLSAKTNNNIDLIINLRNVSEKSHICSVVVDLPKNIGFEQMGIVKQKELRLGQLEPGQSKEFRVSLSANNTTNSGLYTLQLTAYSHYRDYTHILNSVRKPVDLRVV